MNRSVIRRGAAIAAAAAIAASGVIVAAQGAHAEQPDSPPGLAKDKPSRNPKAVAESSTGSYIVVLDDGALVQQFSQEELSSPAARAQGNGLARRHDQLLASVGVGADKKLHSYENTMNGFAALMSHAQAEKLAGTKGVALVLPDELRQLQTDASGDFLGLSGDAGVWQTHATGEGVVIGVIDSGIWPEHASVADDGSYTDLGFDLPCEFGTTTHALAPGYEDDPFECNNKLLGARQVLTAYETLTGLTDIEYDSARDENGHGTHTATTAAGNADVSASIFGIDRGLVTGIAPRARVIAYKALGELGGYSSDLAAAIDQAVEDGVDVINYSIGSSSFAIGPDDISFLWAADAGVHVATSNGNDGPGASTIGSPAVVPWLTSVGASTHDRTFEGSVTVSETKIKKNKPNSSDGTYKGASVTPGTDMLELVDAADLKNPLCLVEENFSGNIEGKIVLCARGQNARVDKSRAVALNGGAGMVLYNQNDAQALVTDNHWVPSVHISFSEGIEIKEYIDTTRKPFAQITGGAAVEVPGSWMADFSSRGPNGLSGDVIKPDVTAPGVNVLAGNTPTPSTGAPGQLFQSISGTSMSSPHVAGLMALIDEVHPEWSPSMVKSALMTTARQNVFKEDGTTPADPFDMGAGHVVPGSMFDPGVVYDAGLFDFVAFTCGADLGVFTPASCDFVATQVPTDPSDYNQASIAIGDLPGSQTVTRTVTNVTGAELVLTPTVDGLTGISATVEPASIVVPAGGSATFEVSFTVQSAPLDKWAFGSLTLSGGSYTARSPIAVKPVPIGIPSSVSATIESGGTAFDVAFGYTGAYGVAGHGLTPMAETIGNVEQDPDQTFAPSDVGNGADVYDIDATNAALLRIHLPQVDPEDNIDLDLFVIAPDGTVYSSGNGGTNETVEIRLPAAGVYKAYVHGWGVGDTPVDYRFQSWVVPLTTGGSLTATGPTEAVIGTTGTVTATWPTDLAPTDYLGAVAHSTPQGTLLTVVEVAPAPAG